MPVLGTVSSYSDIVPQVRLACRQHPQPQLQSRDAGSHSGRGNVDKVAGPPGGSWQAFLRAVRTLCLPVACPSHGARAFAFIAGHSLAAPLTVKDVKGAEAVLPATRGQRDGWKTGSTFRPGDPLHFSLGHVTPQSAASFASFEFIVSARVRQLFAAAAAAAAFWVGRFGKLSCVSGCLATKAPSSFHPFPSFPSVCAC